MKKAIFSFDYELFFGYRSGTVVKTLIEPTDILLNRLEQNGFRGNFFIDYLMFWRLEKITNEDRAKSDLDLLKNQVRDMVRRGHRIELHLHPHWIDAVYNGNGTWNFDEFTHYSLISLSKGEVTDMFRRGTAYLEKMVSDVSPGYKICAFRAGGWAVQPFSHISEGFKAAGITIDSSSCYGTFEEHEYSKFDFRRIPHEPIYRFQEDLGIEDKQGKFVEISITSYRRLLWYKVIDKLSRNLSKSYLRTTDGVHSRSPEKREKKSIHFYNQCMLSLSLSTITCCLISLSKLKTPLVYIDHPKDFHYAMLKTIKYLSIFCTSVFYADYIDFDQGK